MKEFNCQDQEKVEKKNEIVGSLSYFSKLDEFDGLTNQFVNLMSSKLRWPHAAVSSSTALK